MKETILKPTLPENFIVCKAIEQRKDIDYFYSIDGSKEEKRLKKQNCFQAVKKVKNFHDFTHSLEKAYLFLDD